MAENIIKQISNSVSGQSLTDMLTSARHSFTGSVVAKIICKATTEENSPPKIKHLNNLKKITMNPMLSVPDFSNYLLDRLKNSNWVVTFKALITIHHLMHYGHDRFSEYLASCSAMISVPNVSEKSTKATQMNSLIQVYSKYLSVKANCYQLAGYDFCKTKRGKLPGQNLDEHKDLEFYDSYAPLSEEFNMRCMPQEKLFKNLPIIERQLDSLIEVQFTSSELECSIVLAAHLLLYKDLIRLYAVYNEGMINLIEVFFKLDKKSKCQEAMKLFESYVLRLERLNNYVKNSEEYNKTLLPPKFEKEAVIFKPVSKSLIDSLRSHMIKFDEKSKEKLYLKSTSHFDNEIPDCNKSSMILSEEENRLDLFLNVEQKLVCINPFLDSNIGEKNSNPQSAQNFSANNPFIHNESKSALIELADIFSESTPGRGKELQPTGYTNFDQIDISSSHIHPQKINSNGSNPFISYCDNPFLG